MSTMMQEAPASVRVSGRRLQAVLGRILEPTGVTDSIERNYARECLIRTLNEGHQKTLPNIVDDVFSAMAEHDPKDPYYQAAKSLAQVAELQLNKRHIGDAIYTMHGAGLHAQAGVHEQRLGVVLALAHRVGHTGQVNREPWENEFKANLAAQAHIAKLPAKDQLLIQEATLASDYFNSDSVTTFREHYKSKVAEHEPLTLSDRLTARLLDADIVHVLDPELNRVASAELAAEIVSAGIPVPLVYDEGSPAAGDGMERLMSRMENLTLEQRLEFVRSAEFLTPELQELGARDGLENTKRHLEHLLALPDQSHFPVAEL